MSVPTAIRTLTLGPMPLLVIGTPSDGDGAALVVALAAGGLDPLPGLSGVELPRGARLGFVVDGDELRLRDESDTTLLRARRDGLAADWLEAALRLKGTMTVVARDVSVAPDLAGPDLLRDLDRAAQDGRVLGAIVGVTEQRPTLPLLLG